MSTTGTEARGHARLRLGTCPDSWGVWFADDPFQTPWERFLNEVAEVGYEWLELGPYGYLPTDPARLTEELARRGLRVAGGTVHGFSGLHRPGDWPGIARITRQVAELTAAVGGQHLIFVPVPGYRDDKTGAFLEPAELDAEQWRTMIRASDELGKIVAQEYGLRLEFHPHADSHVETQAQTERFLDETDPRYVSLCLDTGHLAYRHADNVAIIGRYPDRIGYVHIKQMDPAIVAQADREGLAFGQAVAMGASCEPPSGEPAVEEVAKALEGLDRDMFVVVEQDMYPTDFDKPKPIAQRTYHYLRGLGIGKGMSMTVQVGVIGVGMIGQDHIRRITQVLTGGAVVAVNDVDASRAGQVAAGLPGAVVHATAADLIADDHVDAVLVASWGPAHEEQVVAAIGAGKPVFCEKPLAPSSDACLRIMEAEMAAGRRLVQVGFMRRYDAGYLAMKAAAGRRQHRRAAADALRAPQPVGAGLRLHHGNDHQRLGGARDRPGPVAVRGGDRGRQRAEAAPQRPGPGRAAGPADPALGAGQRRARRRRAVRQRPVRLRRPRRGRRRDRHRRPGRRQRGDAAGGRTAWRPGPRRLARPVHPGLRRRAAGLAHGGGGRDVDRPELVGRLRRRRGHRQRPGGAAHRPAHRWSPCPNAPSSTRKPGK